MNNPSKNVSKVLNRVEQVAQTLIPANYYFIDLIQTYSRDFPVKKAKTITKSHGDGLQIILTEQLAIWDTISSKLQSLISKYLELLWAIQVRIREYPEQCCRKHGIPVVVLRCRQIGGPAGHGKKQWNIRDWFPILMQTSKALGLIPSYLGAQDLIQLIPADSVSQIIVNLMHGSDTREGLTTFNLINPKLVKRSDLVLGVKQILGVSKEAKLRNWLVEVKKHDALSGDELKKFSALKLLGGFFNG
ncbi:hypothetical protein ACHAO8_003193 [Botrytis cinerea]